MAFENVRLVLAKIFAAALVRYQILGGDPLSKSASQVKPGTVAALSKYVRRGPTLLQHSGRRCVVAFPFRFSLSSVFFLYYLVAQECVVLPYGMNYTDAPSQAYQTDGIPVCAVAKSPIYAES